jgi:hypothetical protein
MFTTCTSPRFADDGSCQHHLEHALQVQYESAQSFVSFYHQTNEIKDRAWVHNSHEKHQNTHKNLETKVGNHRNPLPLWQACIYSALSTGDLQCSLGFLPWAAIQEHSLGVCPQARTSPTHTSNTSQRISNFPLEERRNNRIAFCQNHMKRTPICWWQKALQRRGCIWRKRKRRRIIRRRRGSALCNRAAAQPRPSYPKPLQQGAHIMIPLVRLRGCIIHWMNILFLIH